MGVFFFFFNVISDVMSSFILCLRSFLGNWIASDENMNIGNNSKLKAKKVWKGQIAFLCVI